MNKKYIKRQLILNELGISMSEDIQGYYNTFNKYIGDVNELLCVSSVESRRTYWIKNNNVILEYNINDKYFNVDTNIWSEFSIGHALERKDINKIVSVFLEKQFNLKINFSRSLWWTETESRILTV